MTQRITIYALYEGPESDLPDAADLEDSLRARLEEVYVNIVDASDGKTYVEPIALRVLGCDVEDDD